MSDHNIEKLREEVNPVFTTARSCLRVNAELGDPDAIKMMELLGIGNTVPQPGSDGMTPEMLTFVMQKLTPGFNVMVETRFAASNRLLLESGAVQVVDLPCGYTPRGVRFSREKVRYFGLDLPAVIDAMTPVMRNIIGNNDRIFYYAVDATNFASIRKALNCASDDELLITTEGLLMYLTQSELEEVFQNIRQLLLEFGGKWITTDNEMIPGQNRMLTLLADGDADEMDAIVKLTAGSRPKSTLPENSFLDRSSAEQFVEKMGFQIEKVPMYDYLPQRLLSLDYLPSDKQQAAREIFREVYFWVMTPKSAGSKLHVCEEKNFSAEMKLSGEDLCVVVSGRLDTITAPGFLAMYRETAAEGTISSIAVDMKNLDYISSAGLRALLIMRKTLPDGDQFILSQMNDVVREIMKTTGFDSLFC